MEELEILGNWNIKKGLIKTRFTTVTDKDLEFEEGHEDEMLERVSQKTGLTKEQLVIEINKF